MTCPPPSFGKVKGGQPSHPAKAPPRLETQTSIETRNLQISLRRRGSVILSYLAFLGQPKAGVGPNGMMGRGGSGTTKYP